MNRYKIKIEYDGTPFVGWQRQENGQSVQGCIEKAINKFIEKPEIIKKMGEESVNLIRKKFSDQKIFNNYEGIL